MQRLAAHQTAVGDKDERDGVELERSALQPRAEGQLVERPALTSPVRHEGVGAQRGRDGGALKVRGLSRGVVRQVGGGDVEAREAGQAAEHKEDEEEVVNGRAHADCEGDASGSQAERDLSPRTK